MDGEQEVGTEPEEAATNEEDVQDAPPAPGDESAADEALETITEAVADDLVGQAISNPQFADILNPMVIVTLCGIAIACIALTTATKHALMTLKEGGVKLLDNHWFQAVLQLAQPTMGGVMALAPGLLPFDRPLNVILGICAGFLSPMIYSTLLKRLFPGAVVASDSAKRTAIRMNGKGVTTGNGGAVAIEGGTSPDAPDVGASPEAADAEPTDPTRAEE